MDLADSGDDLDVVNRVPKANTMRSNETRSASDVMPKADTGAVQLTKVIGCGNFYAGDDAVGPLVIGRLQAAGLPGHVACFDAGTSGIDAALAFRDARDVIVIDACRSGHPPGTIFELNHQEIASLQEAARPNFHTLRWDQAIAIADQFCQPRPTAITVFLVEGQNFSLGDAVTPAVADAVEELAVGLLSRLQQPAHGGHAGDRLADQVAQQRSGAT